MDYEKLKNLSAEKSTREIASELGVSQTNVNYWLRKHKLKTPNKCKSKRPLASIIFKCLQCGIEKIKGKSCFGKFCSVKCNGLFLKNKYVTDWHSGLITGTGANNELTRPIRNYLLDKYNYTCVKCGWNERHPIDNLPLVEINHIDGDSCNNIESNLEVICPNCHSKTPNFGSRNKQSSRHKKLIIKADLV